MMSLLTVAVFGAASLELRTPGPDREHETRELRCLCFADDRDLEAVLVRERPHAIVSFGEMARYQNLMTAPFAVRKRWVHFADTSDLDEIGRATWYCLLHNAFENRPDPPLVSVFTPTYRTGGRIRRPLQSLLGQSYTNWEWVVVDDSDDGGATFAELSRLCGRDHRIGAYRAHRHSGRIGEVKRIACGLARGAILVELDHDDELTEGALDAVVAAFAQFPEAGFAYTDWAEVFEDGRNATYGPDWAFGYGVDRMEDYRGRAYLVHAAPHINAKTIRHIVSAPNHIRAWRRDAYWAIGGHCPEMSVADDYELCVRTFLHTRMIRVPRLCYVQFYNTTGNTQRVRNQEIQRLTRNIQEWYDRRIHDRFVELGVEDFVWDAARGATDWSRPNPPIEPHCTLIAAA